jgi:hypothetical protein
VGYVSEKYDRQGGENLDGKIYFHLKFLFIINFIEKSLKASKNS